MRVHKLRSLLVDIVAPRALVFEMAAATSGTLPGAPAHTAEVLERNANELLVRYRIPALLSELIMLERVRLFPPERIEYEVLQGPLELVREYLAFQSIEPRRTTVHYGGVVGSGRRLIGPLIAGLVAVPAYDRFMRRQLRALKEAAEARALRSRRFWHPDAA